LRQESQFAGVQRGGEPVIGAEFAIDALSMTSLLEPAPILPMLNATAPHDS
jgi:hypothetical protein